MVVRLLKCHYIASVEVSGQELVPLQAGWWVQVATIITVTETGHARVSGQALDLEFTTGGGPDGKYTVVTVLDADTFTVTPASGPGPGTTGAGAVNSGHTGALPNAGLDG